MYCKSGISSSDVLNNVNLVVIVVIVVVAQYVINLVLVVLNSE